ncbi:helix-turn-helix transcriptional regulator [Loktanella agnita]|uniref:helix-turn-helix transcriptional regulator n=1 Tax=Loktanella agnita TaxID=287097 RepID=UPI003985F69F
MSRSERLFRLLQALRQLPQPVTAARLATETEVSERTLYRDIDSLRAGGALIDGAPGYGYTLTEDPALPPQMFDRLEVEALVLGLSDVQQRGDRDLANAASAALAKISASLPERVQRQVLHATHMAIRTHADPATLPDMSVIRAALWGEEELEVDYVDAAGRATTRRVYPLVIAYVESKIGLLGWCCLRQDYRHFLLPRINGLRRSGASFRPGRAALLRDYAKQRETRYPAPTDATT